MTLTVTPEILEKETLAELDSQPVEIWRRGRDLNSRMGYPISGFQDRHVRPLRHPSDFMFQAVTRLRISDGGIFGGISPSTAAAFRDGETCP